MIRTKIDVLPNNNINVWTDEAEKKIMGIRNLEGIASCQIISPNLILVTVDPRYDQKEVSEKIRMLLIPEIPDAFGRQRSAEPETLFDSSFEYDLQPLFWQ
jgi:hypothetical protein